MQEIDVTPSLSRYFQEVVKGISNALGRFIRSLAFVQVHRQCHTIICDAADIDNKCPRPESTRNEMCIEYRPFKVEAEL